MNRVMLVFAHIGDTHIVDPRMQNARDLLAIAAQIEMNCAAMLDFVVLPGDVADNGLPSQYAFVRTALRMLSVPVHAIPGDHDMEGGSLAAFHDILGQDRLPVAVTAGGVRCVFLDMSGPGAGGPDFRLGAGQVAWLERELAEAGTSETPVAVFMHSYPTDLVLGDEAAAVTKLLSRHAVALVDIGHTHYNELANDGRTIFAATRSTGQIEEGPVGYAVAAIDDGVVSWRFKLLDDPFPWVMITAPADRRLVRGPDQVVSGQVEVRALVFGLERLRAVELRVADGPWRPMSRTDGDRSWRAEVAVPNEPRVTIAVRAIDETGRPGMHAVEAAGGNFIPVAHKALGSDEATIGAWPENGIWGTQLGPNRNARPAR